jgi:hypothetical protein
MLGPGAELMVTPTLGREVVHGQMALGDAGVAADLARATAQEIDGAFDDLGRRDRRNAELVQPRVHRQWRR